MHLPSLSIQDDPKLPGLSDLDPDYDKDFRLPSHEMYIQHQENQGTPAETPARPNPTKRRSMHIPCDPSLSIPSDLSVPDSFSSIDKGEITLAGKEPRR